MSRLVVIRNCVDCPHRGAMWCDLERRSIEVMDAYLEFPQWCPLPELGEKEESK